MAKVLSSISGNLISAASAGYAPTNSADVSAIASGYQVVSSTATQLYAGTAFLTGVNGDPISASRAGQAANASLANSAYYDGTGRLISSLPDSAAVSSIASSYAESAVSSKADSSALSSYALSSDVSGVIDTVSSNSATWGQGGVDSATVSAIASAYQVVSSVGDDGTYITSINGSALSGAGGGGGATGDYVENSALDSATARSSTGNLLPPVTGISSISGEPLIPKLLAQPTMQYGGQSTFAYMPDTSIWTTADVATGVFSPLQFATGACLSMDAGNFKAYYKGNEWFVSNTASNGGMLRGEIHASRGIRVVGSAKDSISGFQLHPSGVNGVDMSGHAWQYGYAEYNQLTSVHDTVSSNSASWGGGGGTGDYVEKSATEVTIGSSNAAVSTAFAQGTLNIASSDSFAQGYSNTAKTYSFAQANQNSASGQSFAQGSKNSAKALSFAQGTDNIAYSYSFAQGTTNYADSYSFAQGSTNDASSYSFAQGSRNSASGYSFAQGRNNRASSYSFAQGSANTAISYSFAQGIMTRAYNTAAAFGQYNLRANGSTSSGESAAFVIGDGTASDFLHDLMVVTKNGEITMYSSTADTVGTGIMSSLRAISAAATGGGATLPITGSSGVDSASYDATGIEYIRHGTAFLSDKRTAYYNHDGMSITSTLNDYTYYSMRLNDTGLEFSSDDMGRHTVDAYSIDSWNDAVDTVSSNSATWGQGGVDSATVSAIASGYAESAASSKLDTTAFNSGDFYTTANESGYVGSSYVDSAVSGKMDTSAMTSYALSADVSGTVDLVSTQSANWGGSALALSAGPGISLTMVGNTLVISTAGV